MKVRIYINGRFLTQPITGVQRYGRELVQGFDRMMQQGEIDPQRYELIVLTPNTGVSTPEFQHLQVQGVGRFGGHLWEQMELPRYCVVNLLFCPANIAPLRSFYGPGKTILTLHDLSFIYFSEAYSLTFALLYEVLVDRAIREVSGVITVSEYERQRILKIFPDLSAHLVSISSGVRPYDPPLAPCPTTVSEPYILFVSSINRIKNLETLLEALYLIQSSYRIPLKVVGSRISGVFRKVDLSRILNNVDNVEFLGQINDPQLLRKLYSEATFLVMPSFTESFGFPCLEAMSYGCPVLASDIGALKEVCGPAALYCNPSSAEDIAEKLIILWNHPEKRRAMSALGYDRAKQFTWERTARQTWKVLCQAAESS